MTKMVRENSSPMTAQHKSVQWRSLSRSGRGTWPGLFHHFLHLLEVQRVLLGLVVPWYGILLHWDWIDLIFINTNKASFSWNELLSINWLTHMIHLGDGISYRHCFNISLLLSNITQWKHQWVSPPYFQSLSSSPPTTNSKTPSGSSGKGSQTAIELTQRTNPLALSSIFPIKTKASPHSSTSTPLALRKYSPPSEACVPPQPTSTHPWRHKFSLTKNSTAK